MGASMPSFLDNIIIVWGTQNNSMDNKKLKTAAKKYIPRAGAVRKKER